jgi:hypothetical protein
MASSPGAKVFSLLHQLWNKGVDIAATVLGTTISAGIVAGIGTLAWRWNKKRDLMHEAAKQRQQHKIAQELDSAKSNREIQDVRDRAKRTIEVFVNAVSTEEPRELAVRYFVWLRREKLDVFNHHIVSEEASLTARPTSLSPTIEQARRERLRRVFLSTDLPKIST